MREALIQIPDLPPRNVFYDGLKRLIDIVACVVLLTLFSLPLLILAIAIRCSSPGRILYRQRRVGKDSRCFECYKFRTMHADADRSGPLITSADDDRITPIGRFLQQQA